MRGVEARFDRERSRDFIRSPLLHDPNGVEVAVLFPVMLRPRKDDGRFHPKRVAGILRNLAVQKHAAKKEEAMSPGVRVLKRGRNDRSKNLLVDPSEKTNRQTDREIVSTVKSWIAELDLRRLSRRTEALRLLK